MAVNLKAIDEQNIFPVAGVELGVTQGGIRKSGKDDVTVIKLVEGSLSCGVFTKNRFCAAPVQVCQKHLAETKAIKALVINTGTANAGLGEKGLVAAQKSCEALANLLHVNANQILPFSTGVIMEDFPTDRLVKALPTALAHVDASPASWRKAATAIMTTDTMAKASSVQLKVGGELVTITGISKGAGMIRPNMATMLSFVATDAKVSAPVLQVLTKRAADASFNRITVDGDTSTNDSFIVMATQQCGGDEITDVNSKEALQLFEGIQEVAVQLAQAIVRDGEGATKFIEVNVEGGKTVEECQKVAYAIAHSPLVKTAFFASDPNLGRILAAVGYAGIDDLEQGKIELYLDDVHVVVNGGRHPNYKEADGINVMKQAEITVRVKLGRGEAKTTVWTCDFSHEYVSINANYRS